MASKFLSFLNKDKKEPKNLKEILSQFNDLKRNFEKISKELESLKKEQKFSVQKVGIVRFSAFKEVGGNQSFSIALLDARNSGAVITSIYTREDNRVYGKPISQGSSEYNLSEEEKEAIKKAINQNNGKGKSKFNIEAADSGGSGAH